MLAKLQTLETLSESVRTPEWATIARPEQLPPPGAWLVWLIEAGRGWGKTRTGAEWLWEQAKTNPRVAIVAPTFGDARDTCIEGETGIKALHRDLDFNRSIGEMTFPSGAKGKLFSGEEPDRLRGPNNYAAWCDEMCLIAGTLISTARGQVPIENIKSDDLIWTRDGLRRVKRAWCTSMSEAVYELRTSDNRSLIGTAHHPVWINEIGFVPLTRIPYGGILTAWDISLNQASLGAGVAGGLTAVTTAIEGVNYSIAQFTQNITERFRRGQTYTTRTKTKPITTPQTSKPSRAQNTSSVTVHAVGEAGLKINAPSNLYRVGKSENLISRLAKIAARSFLLPERVLVSVAETAKPITPITTLNTTSIVSADFAARRLSLTGSPVGRVASVLVRASRKNTCRNFSARVSELLSRALFAAKNFSHKTIAPYVAPKHAGTSFAIAGMLSAPTAQSVKPLPFPQAVYNLEVEGCHEYFANGILTHNSSWRYQKATWDNLMFTLRKGESRACITTTPKKSKLLVEIEGRETTALVRRPTYDNIANLSRAYVENIIKPYEGTRLGRQELEALVLDDEPGALWKRETLDLHRVTSMPEMERIIVGVDPTATSGGDEAGIIVDGRARVGKDQHLYTLDDLSLHGSPRAWATAAVTAYHKWKANAIVAEANNGGEMVAAVIHQVDANVPVKLVHASRGKQTRAEPISTLCEQGREHHVGVFAQLEDEQCQWVPGMDSPNRMDAHVWAATELMLTATGWARGAAG